MGISLLGLWGSSGVVSSAPPTIPVPATPNVPSVSVPDYVPPPVRMAQPPASLPPGGPRPQLIPADVYPTTKQPTAVPGQVMTYQKPSGGTVAQPVARPTTMRPVAQPVAQSKQTPTPEVSPTMENIISIDPKDVFRLDDDETFNRRMVELIVKEENERRKKNNQASDPLTVENYPLPKVAEEVIPTASQLQRRFEPMQLLIEPSYVVHRRLLFEEKNAELYGWDFGIAQPVISTAHFFGDVVLWPARLASNLHEPYDTSAGKCPPGSPLPYYLYPPAITPFGALVGVATIGGTLAIFP